MPSKTIGKHKKQKQPFPAKFEHLLSFPFPLVFKLTA
jgi:hypothetical protein